MKMYCSSFFLFQCADDSGPYMSCHLPADRQGHASRTESADLPAFFSQNPSRVGVLLQVFKRAGRDTGCGAASKGGKGVADHSTERTRACWMEDFGVRSGLSGDPPQGGGPQGGEMGWVREEGCSWRLGGASGVGAQQQGGGWPGGGLGAAGAGSRDGETCGRGGAVDGGRACETCARRTAGWSSSCERSFLCLLELGTGWIFIDL